MFNQTRNLFLALTLLLSGVVVSACTGPDYSQHSVNADSGQVPDSNTGPTTDAETQPPDATPELDVGDDEAEPDECAQPAIPQPDYCSLHEPTEPVLDQNGCLSEYRCCSASGPQDEAACLEGPGYAWVEGEEDQFGCAFRYCANPGEAFPCGPSLHCAWSYHFCLEVTSESSPNRPPTYECVLMPEACEGQERCDCLIEEVGDGSCSPDGAPVLRIAQP